MDFLEAYIRTVIALQAPKDAKEKVVRSGTFFCTSKTNRLILPRMYNYLQ